MPWSGIISELFLNTEYSDTDIRTCICLTKNYILTYCFQMFAYRETVLEEAHRGMELREHCRHIVDKDDRHYRFHSLCVHQGIGVSSRTTPFPFPSFSAHAQLADSLLLSSSRPTLIWRCAFHGIFSLPFSLCHVRLYCNFVPKLFTVFFHSLFHDIFSMYLASKLVFDYYFFRNIRANNVYM